MFRFLHAAAAVLMLGAGIAAADVQIQSGGATFPNPIYQQWIKDFGQAHNDIKIAYAAKGSGAGIGGLLDKTFDFAGSDAPMNDDELKKAQAVGGDVVEIPSVAGAVVLAYNLPGFSGDLNLSGPVVADIYLGRITKWNDPAISALNPNTNLPATDITTVHRSDGSGTNFVFSSYLCTQSDDFQTKVNFGKTVNWPTGQGGSGNAGVTQAVQKTEGAIGYIELNYALKNGIPFAMLQNNGGKFIKASPQSVSAAGEGAVKDMDEDKTLAVRLWSRDGDDVYPISSFTYLICYKDLSYLNDRAKAQAIVDFFWYATHDGQSKAADLTYAPLSSGVQQRVEQAIETITFNGHALHPTNK
ncbi:MAG TPA: phosphate ABC transporter substrate-binding protein PstS [Tepidisphaeraceae bacterium]|nr:phosphate ABC transporter substrate-binding protein PstS [Tepidisphaeraceae bacterium]